MKIRIIKEIPVKQESKPTVGGIYEVLNTENMRGRNNHKAKYTIRTIEEVGVFDDECEVVED